MKRNLILLTLAIVTLLWGQAVFQGNLEVTGHLDMADAAQTTPAKVGTALPGTCTVGEQFFKSDATAGSNIYLCTATNTWTAVTGGGGGGTSDCSPGDLRYVCLHEEFVSGTTATGQVGALGWVLSSSTGAASYPEATWPRPGVLQLLTNATSGNAHYIRLGGSTGTLGNIAAGSDKLQDSKWVFRLTDAADVDLRVGWGNYGSAGDLATGFSVGSTGGNFALTAKTGFSETTLVSLGVPLDTAWHTVRFYTDGATASRVLISFDGAAPVTICASGCTINSTYAHIFGTSNYVPIAVVETLTTAAKGIQLDYFGYKATVGTTEHVR